MKLNLKTLIVSIAACLFLSSCSSGYVVYSNKDLEIKAPADYVDSTDFVKIAAIRFTFL